MARIKAKLRQLPIDKNERDNSLDYLRGIAVFLMIFAHLIHFVSTGEHQTLRFIEGVANTVCFTIFLFVSGSVAYLAYLKEGVYFRTKISDILRRVVYMLFGYYLLAFSAAIDQFAWPPSTEWFSTAGNILIFNNVPGFTEFIIPFILISFLLLIFYSIFKFTSKNLILTIILSITAFLIGSLLFPLQVPDVLIPYKALFVGNFEFYRFPLLQYLPIFFFGLYWGHLIVSEADVKRKEKAGFLFGTAFIMIFGLSELITSYLNIPYIEPLNRWPPSIGFIAIGLAFTFFSIPIILNFLKIKILDPLNRFFVYIGQDAFDMFIFSTFLLFLYRQVSNYQFTEIGFVIAGLIILLGASMLLASFNSFHSASLFRQGTDIVLKKQKFFRKRYVILAVAMMIIVFNNLKLPVYSDVAGAIITPIDIEGTTPLTVVDSIPWWENEYGYYKQINIENKHPFLSIGTGAHIEIIINHKNLVTDGKSQNDGSDIRIVYFTGTEFITVPFSIQDVNTSETVLQVEILSRIYPQKLNNRYFLYYGNDDAEPHTYNQWTETLDQPVETTFGMETVSQISVEVDRKWLLKSKTIEASSITVTVTLNDASLANSDIYYFIPGGTKLSVPMHQITPITYQSEINADVLLPGEYEVHVFATIENSEETISGQSLKIQVSYPIFIAWTIDWEGYDETDDSLQRLSSVAAKHDIPLTHFFNPRIYMPDVVSESRADELTRWVKDRGDTVGLHIHMHKDLVAAAGVTPKDFPRWGNYEANDGLDIPTSEYSGEEVKKIVSWGIEQFTKNGLPKPTLYRAGGWFADMEVLQALDDLGFKLDSSGRTPELWWTKYAHIWSLEDTTQPYKPSLENQNSVLPPTLDLWEFPNNGGDATAYSADQMIENFKKNWIEGLNSPLSEKRLVTYLSHPRYFDVDGPRMEEVFGYIDQFLFENDEGPAIYIDLEQAYLEWTVE